MIRRKLGRGASLLGLLLVLAEAGYGQSTAQPQEITVFLKNGKIVRGMTTLSMFEGYFTVEEDAFNQTHIPYADIAQIVFGPISDATKVKVKKVNRDVPFTIKEKGYFGMIDFGFLMQNRSYLDYGLGGGVGVTLTMVNGYAFNPHVRVGLGVGLESYGYNSLSTAPVFLSLSGLVNKRRWSPYYFLNAGGSTAWVNQGGYGVNTYDTKGGLMLQPGVGYRYNVGKVGVSFGIGYKMQKARVRYRWEDWNTGNQMEIEVDERRTLRRLSMTVGVHF